MLASQLIPLIKMGKHLIGYGCQSAAHAENLGLVGKQ